MRKFESKSIDIDSADQVAQWELKLSTKGIGNDVSFRVSFHKLSLPELNVLIFPFFCDSWSENQGAEFLSDKKPIPYIAIKEKKE